MKQWDLVHCPAGTRHVIVGAGEGPCLVVAMGGRGDSTGPNWGAYAVDEAARRYGASVERETSDGDVAYARFPPRENKPFAEGGWLPE